MLTILQALLPIFLALLTSTSALERGLWPLVTPILGDISDECRDASKEYINALNTILTTGNVTDRMWAVQMFDAGGTLPFLQEGVLLDTKTHDINICDALPKPAQAQCETLPASLRTLHIGIPIGYANGPGSETSCRQVRGRLASGGEVQAKYCHNYLVPYGLNHTPPGDNGSKGGFRDLSKMNIQESLKTAVNAGHFRQDLPEKTAIESSDDTDKSNLVNPFLGKYRTFFQYFKQIEQKVVDILNSVCIECLEKDMLPNIQNILIGSILALWYQDNGFLGVGSLAPGAYYGGCFPQSCSVEDIEKNADAFALQFANPALIVTSSPRVPNFYGIPGLTVERTQAMMEGSVGCTDWEKYSGKWKTENYVMVIVFALIGFLIFIGTAIEAFQNNKAKEKQLTETPAAREGIALTIIKSFSMLNNLDFLFGVSHAGSSERLSCMEGMRAISMTWVILGHNFLFGSSMLQINNKEAIFRVNRKETSMAIEAVLQGDYSVDSFFFIGATLVSYLLLKDLDKTNGWTNKEGLTHMILFYVNRYLRITIPYALVLAFFIGIAPLLISEPINAASWAIQESEMCKKWAWTHLLYVNNYFEQANYCLGHTWFLSTDMIFYFLSPLLIYPLWTSKFGLVQKICSHFWWVLLVCSSVGLSYSYSSDKEAWGKWAMENSLPTYSFAPWGHRNQCYLVGIMLGYILHITKEKGIKIDNRLNILIWQVVFLVAFALIYSPHDPSIKDNVVFFTFHRLAWGLCLAWVTFSCCRGTGGLVNDFLSWDFFLPISKISFMTYFLHMSFNWYYFFMQDYTLNFSMWLMTEIFVAQVAVCLFLGVIFSLACELPFNRIQKTFISLLVGSTKQK